MNTTLQNLITEFATARARWNEALAASNDAPSDAADYWLDRQDDLSWRIANHLADSHQNHGKP